MFDVKCMALRHVASRSRGDELEQELGRKTQDYWMENTTVAERHKPDLRNCLSLSFGRMLCRETHTALLGRWASSDGTYCTKKR